MRKKQAEREASYLAFEVDSTEGLGPRLFECRPGFSSQADNVIIAFLEQLLVIIDDELSSFGI
jgi:hypothetical protein